MDDPTLVARLERFLHARLPAGPAPRIVRLERSTDGFSQETFSFEVEHAHGERRGPSCKRSRQA